MSSPIPNDIILEIANNLDDLELYKLLLTTRVKLPDSFWLNRLKQKNILLSQSPLDLKNYYYWKSFSVIPIIDETGHVEFKAYNKGESLADVLSEIEGDIYLNDELIRLYIPETKEVVYSPFTFQMRNLKDIILWR